MELKIQLPYKGPTHPLFGVRSTLQIIWMSFIFYTIVESLLFSIVLNRTLISIDLLYTNFHCYYFICIIIIIIILRSIIT